jgi:L-alanine-DL-glutamate epimerase-like enolase superfamily enzyme
MHIGDEMGDIPYASHGGGAHLHLLAALPNMIFLESGLLAADSEIALVDGCYPLPETPGLGTHA